MLGPPLGEGNLSLRFAGLVCFITAFVFAPTSGSADPAPVREATISLRVDNQIAGRNEPITVTVDIVAPTRPQAYRGPKLGAGLRPVPTEKAPSQNLKPDASDGYHRRERLVLAGAKPGVFSLGPAEIDVGGRTIRSKTLKIRVLDGPFTGSLSGPVKIEDITYTIRQTIFGNMTVSRLQKDLAYATTYDGYIFKTLDGGKTWDESRLLTERRGYYGDEWQRLYFGIHRKDATRSAYHNGPGAQGGYPGNPVDLNRGGADPDYSDFVGRSVISPGSSIRAGAAQNINFGIGLPGVSPRLQAFIRHKKKPTAGLNIKQTLLLRGTLPTFIRFAIEHPTNPQIVYGLTDYGLYVSNDQGLNWVRIFIGMNPTEKVDERMIHHLAIDPLDNKRCFSAQPTACLSRPTAA